MDVEESATRAANFGEMVSPEIKKRAYEEVKKALASGELVRSEVCEECGRKRKIESAHYNYAEPLNVRWLCKICHSTWDGRKNRGEFTTAKPLSELLGFIELQERRDHARRYRTGMAVRTAREALGVTQTELAAELGTSQSYVSQVESGSTSASAAQLYNIKAALEATRALRRRK